MGTTKPPSAAMATTLSETMILLDQLRDEPWAEYDRVLTAACHLLAKHALDELKKVAKAVSQITPAESKTVPGVEPWYGGVLDDMR